MGRLSGGGVYGTPELILFLTKLGKGATAAMLGVEELQEQVETLRQQVQTLQAQVQGLLQRGG